MPDPVHESIFKQGPESWNRWRQLDPSLRPDLRHLCPPLKDRINIANVRHPLNFRDVDATASDLRFFAFDGANFSEGRFAAADFSDSSFVGANFSSADLSFARFNNADVAGAIFDEAVLDGASLAFARNLSQAQIDAARGDQETLLPFSLRRPQSWGSGGSQETVSSAKQRPPAGRLYRLLGVPTTATEAEIRRAYRESAKVLHPDAGGMLSHLEEGFKGLNQATALLLARNLRTLYDRDAIDENGNPVFSQARRGLGFFAAGAAALAFSLIAISALLFFAPWKVQNRALEGAVAKAAQDMRPAQAFEQTVAMSDRKSGEAMNVAVTSESHSNVKRNGEDFRESTPQSSSSAHGTRLLQALNATTKTERRGEALSATILFQQSLEYYGDGDLAKAIDGFSKVLSVGSQEMAALVNRGNAFDDVRDSERAHKDYQSALALYPDNPIVFYNRGIMFARAGDTDRALADFDRVIRTGFSDAVVYDHRGWLWYEKHQYDRALADIDRAIKLDTTLRDAYRHRGLVLLARSEAKDAALDFTKAIERDGTDGLAYVHRARAYLHQGRQADAISDLNHFVALSPSENLWAKNLIDTIIERQGVLPDAIWPGAVEAEKRWKHRVAPSGRTAEGH